MRASTVMALGMILYVIHRWAANKTAVDAKTVVEGVFAIAVVAMLDQGRTEGIAKGFAWLFFVVAAYNAIPNLNTALTAKGNQPKKTAA